MVKLCSTGEPKHTSVNVNHPDYVPSVFPAAYRTSAGNIKAKRAERLDRARKRAEDKEATKKQAEEEERRHEEEATVNSEDTTEREVSEDGRSTGMR